MKSAEYEDMDPDVFRAAIEGQLDELLSRESSETGEATSDEGVIIESESTDEAMTEVQTVDASESEPVRLTPSERETNVSAENSEISTEETEHAVSNTVSAEGSETEMAEKSLVEEKISRKERRALKKAEAKEKASKKAKKEKKQTIEEQYLVDENGARKRFLSWKWNNAISNIFLVASCGVFLVCAIELGTYFYSSYQYKASISELQEGMGGGIDNSDKLAELLTNQENGDVLVFPDEEAYDIVGAVSHKTELSDTWKAQYEYLTSVNPDCVGYISIPNSVLSYPVMFTPSDYTYYLYRNFSGENEYRGTPFLDYRTKLGKSQNVIIYGHNMTDGMMFGTLREYLDKAYYEDHKYVYFNTAYGEGIYEVMAVVKTKIYRVDDTDFKYYRYGGQLTKSEFETYVSNMLRLSEYSTGVTATWGDELISLSTCNRYTEDGRLVIVCKRIN